MKKLFIFLSIILLLNGCFKTPIKTGAISEENRANLSSLAIGMSPDQVLEVMSYPYSTHEKLYDNKVYEIWYYITEPTLLGQSKLITRNFTPLVFENGHLKGWGNNFYKYTFDIEGQKSKVEEDKRQQYTDDSPEWPTSEHRSIEPMSKSSKKASSNQKIQNSQCFPTSSSTQSPSLENQAPPTILQPQTDTTSKPTSQPSNEKIAAPQESSDSSKGSQTPAQQKPACCESKTTKTNACQKYKEPQKEDTIQKQIDEKTPDQEKSPCETRKDTDEGYNFWE
jgi:outer membrane protein assembly factor BamE (lipoprotein component of BamABCDE complex)